jgi:hypothetical protein
MPKVPPFLFHKVEFPISPFFIRLRGIGCSMAIPIKAIYGVDIFGLSCIFFSSFSIMIRERMKQDERKDGND